jgi:HEAT repeat protein
LRSVRVSELERVLVEIAEIEDRHEYFRAMSVMREQVRPATIQAAVELLREVDDEAVRRAAAELLGADVGDRMAAERLEDAALIGGLHEPLEAVAMELGRLRATEGIRTLRVLALEDDEGIRRAVAQGLGGLAPAVPEAVKMLVVLSGDSSTLVRARATQELAASGVDTPEVRDALATRLDDPDAETRALATRRLAELD